MPEESIVELLKSKGAPANVINRVQNMIKLYRERRIDAEDLFNYVVGVAWNYYIDISPREVGYIMQTISVV